MNAHGIGHGGVIWTLADVTFGAVGYYDGQILTTFSTLSFLRPAKTDSILVASARQITRTSKPGHFEVQIREGLNAESKVIAIGQFSGQWLRSLQSRHA